MAGIGIELRRLTSENSFFNFLRAHLYAGILGSGSWVISISILTAISFYNDLYLGFSLANVQFLVSITYLVSSSLILSAILQQTVSRYISDRIFDNRLKLIATALFSASLILMIASSIIGVIAVQLLIPDQSIQLKFIMVGCFVELNLIWLFSNALAGLKEYKIILYSYLLGYFLIFWLSTLLFELGVVGLLFSFYCGLFILLIGFLIFVTRAYAAKRFIDKGIINFTKANPHLAFAGLFFQLAIWVDKYCFWINPETSNPILQSLRNSPVYDMPMYLSFMMMVPGLASFFYEMEANFSRYYMRYYDAIRDGATLTEINDKLAALIANARLGFTNTLLIQLFITMLGYYFTVELLSLLKLPSIYRFIFRIDMISAFLLVLLLAQFSYIYHLNRNKEMCYLCMFFFLTNLLFTQITIVLGPPYYGYGFAISLLCTNIVSMLLLLRLFKKLTYYTFMS